MKKDIIICGVGGQGTVLASKIIAAAAMEHGEIVHSAETIGMAQRGGSVTSHVRIGEEAYSPLIPYASADLIIGFEPAEAVRNLIYLNKGGLVITNTSPTKPVTESLHKTGYNGVDMVDYLKNKCRTIAIDGEEICREYGSARYLNIVLLGVTAASSVLDLPQELIINEIKRRVPAKFLEINLSAFQKGYEIGQTYQNHK